MFVVFGERIFSVTLLKALHLKWKVVIRNVWMKKEERKKKLEKEKQKRSQAADIPLMNDVGQLQLPFLLQF